MTTTEQQPTPRRAPGVRAIPAGYTTVTPWIVTPDTAALIAFARRAFDAEEIACLRGPDGKVHHAELRIGDAIVMAFDSAPGWPPTPALLRLYVEDGDATHRRAVAAGAVSVTEMTELFFGARVGRVRDPLGNLWWIQEHLEDLDHQELMRREALPRYREGMAYVQSMNPF